MLHFSKSLSVDFKKTQLLLQEEYLQTTILIKYHGVNSNMCVSALGESIHLLRELSTTHFLVYCSFTFSKIQANT